MSAFLGPIHYWLYHKIQVQQEILDEILVALGEIVPDLTKDLDSRYGISETRPLEEIIDEGNIHGWLQSRVSQAEYKLAFSITTLLKKDPVILKKLVAIYQGKGEEQSLTTSMENAKEVYKVISDSLLDGMPCDNANTVLEEGEYSVVWRRNSCVHRNYWEEVGGDITIYYDLREAFIRGFLMGTTLEFVKIDDVTNQIRRCEINE